MSCDKNIVPVSVIIPCFRCSATIRRAVDSVFAQHAVPSEVILVDDCSEDDTLETLYELERTFVGRIKVIRNKVNSGAASARNAGWSLAVQPYIAFLDADDSWHPEKLNIQYEYMRSHPEVAMSGHQCVCLRSNEPQVLPKPTLITSVTAFSMLFKNAFSTTSPVMLKGDIPYRFKEGMRYSEDFLLWLQISFAGLQVVRIESPLSYSYKAMYGENGLSAQLWKMEKGELGNFSELYNMGKISRFTQLAACCFSLAKFSKRVVFTYTAKLSSVILGRGSWL